jgi:hypothetical protein
MPDSGSYPALCGAGASFRSPQKQATLRYRALSLKLFVLNITIDLFVIYRMVDF